MTLTQVRRLAALSSCLIAGALAAAPFAAAAKSKAPIVATRAATHVLGTSALLTARVDPNGTEAVTYFFQWGATAAYGQQTPSASLPAGTVSIPVGQPIVGLTPGATYHYRIVAADGAGTSFGRDHTLRTKGSGLTFELPRVGQAVYGTPFFLTGALRGQGAANHGIVLQASPFPYLEPFTSIGLPGVTNAAGRFSFRVANLNASTQFRVSTLDPLPLYSRVITVNVGVRVVLHVRASGRPGLVRLYGTITPAVNRAVVALQVLKPVRPGRNEEETSRYVSQFSTLAKRGAHNTSRFSIVATIRHAGRYRALVRPRPGPLASGTSNTIVLRAAKKK